MDPNRWRLIEHTADLGIEVFGTDIKQLFLNAAFGMYSLALGTLPKEGILKSLNREDIFIEKEAIDLNELLVLWLTDLLFFLNVRRFYSDDIKILTLLHTYIQTRHFGYILEKESFQHELKAVTFHGINIRRDDEKGIFSTQIIFDV
jgi:SHS2 domain-containing protein